MSSLPSRAYASAAARAPEYQNADSVRSCGSPIPGWWAQRTTPRRRRCRSWHPRCTRSARCRPCRTSPSVRGRPSPRTSRGCARRRRSRRAPGRSASPREMYWVYVLDQLYGYPGCRCTRSHLRRLSRRHPGAVGVARIRRYLRSSTYMPGQGDGVVVAEHTLHGGGELVVVARDVGVEVVVPVEPPAVVQLFSMLSSGTSMYGTLSAHQRL